ncbi:antitoxin YezG family protein [Bacillus safensis]|uniref:antitoxin YezG family protein n=1 Tax=Bacillus safensis TaxID=561879 RepID=UPI000DACCEB1|nr:antitoxin YezG family protein [Bacillus safensis]
MNEEEPEYVYKQIVDVIARTIPVKWTKVYLYCEVVEGSQTAYFYFSTEENDDQPVYSHDITQLFEVSEHEYKERWHQLVDCIQELRRVFEQSGQEPWTNLTMIFNETGDFNIEFNYDDLSNTNPHERKTIWKYNHLGIIPKSNSGKKHLEKYLSTMMMDGI